MKCSVFIATSADGYIATLKGSVDWLQSAGNVNADMHVDPDMGFTAFIDSVDCMIMGRKCMDVLSSFNLTPEQWPYRDIKIYVLSNSITTPPENLHGKVEMYSGDITDLIHKLAAKNFKHAYIDGGRTITAFMNLKLINEITITKAPIILGEGIPLFGKIENAIALKNAKSIAYPNDFIQVKYSIDYL